jgi:hypothetical protein
VLFGVVWFKGVVFWFFVFFKCVYFSHSVVLKMKDYFRVGV